MKTSDELLRDVCHTVMNDLFPYEKERKLDMKTVDDQLYELQKLSVELTRLALDARQNGATDDALWQVLWRVIR